jgi:hypothetical protein
VKNHNCSECGRPHIVQDPHKESLSQLKCRMLRMAADHVVATGRNDFKKSDLPAQNHNEYANFQKLRYHGLIAKVLVSTGKSRDRWLITRRGWAFLRGEVTIPKWVVVQYNALTGGASNEHVSLTDIERDGAYLETQFEYFDEMTGEMIGLRPIGTPEHEQARLPV